MKQTVTGISFLFCALFAPVFLSCGDGTTGRAAPEKPETTRAIPRGGDMSPAPETTAPAAGVGDDETTGNPSVKITKTAAAALKKKAAAGGGPWVIFYQGLCAGKPSLGIFASKDDPPAGSVPVVADGMRFIIEKDVVALIKKHGGVEVRGPFQEGGDVEAGFSAYE